MARTAAGILVYRRRGGELEVFLAHPGGPYWRRKDDGAWTLPKGEVENGEEPLAAARREFREEIGQDPAGPFLELGAVRMRSGKQVLAWACEGDLDPALLSSNTFEVEWPPRSGRRAEFPEVDRADFFPLEVARRKLLAAQLPLLDALEARLGSSPGR